MVSSVAAADRKPSAFPLSKVDRWEACPFPLTVSLGGPQGQRSCSAGFVLEFIRFNDDGLALTLVRHGVDAERLDLLFDPRQDDFDRRDLFDELGVDTTLQHFESLCRDLLDVPVQQWFDVLRVRGTLKTRTAFRYGKPAQALDDAAADLKEIFEVFWSTVEWNAEP